MGFSIGPTFFGFALPIYGYLIVCSGYPPRWLGVLYGLAGACYLLNSYAYFFAVDLPLTSYAMAGSLIGEGALALWLLVWVGMR